MNNDKLLVKGCPPPPLSRVFSVVGKSINRLDGWEKVTGQANYSGDIKLPGMLFGKILHCPHTRARIVSIDKTLAEALPGVHLILTKDNTRSWRTLWYNVSEPAFPDVITREGQEVAVVVADDILTAKKAIELINVEYEILIPKVDFEGAIPFQPFELVENEKYPGKELFDNIPFVIKRGDIDKGFAEADVIIEDTYATSAQYHCTIQTRACIASWDGYNLTVWDALQGVWNPKIALAKSLNLSPDRVRVVVKYLGGGFGSKAWAHRISFYAAKLSMLTGKPIRMEQTRSEEFLLHPHRFACKFYLKIGAKNDGLITAIYEKALINIGAAAGVGSYQPKQIIWQTSNLYDCPNEYLEQIGIYTNIQLTGYTRSPYQMPAIYPLEIHIDKVANAIGMDPLEFRLRNYKKHASTHSKQDLMDSEIKLNWSSKKLDECMLLVTQAIDWGKRQTFQDGAKGSKRRGIGMASFIAIQGGGVPPNNANADLDIHNDGVIVLHIGVVDIGGGQKTTFAMIAAEELGVRAEDLTINYGDTQNTQYAPSAHVSRVTAEMGPPVLKAASEARQKLFEIVAPSLNAEPSELESVDGNIYVRTDIMRTIPFKMACKMISPNGFLRGTGSRKVNPDSPIFSSFGAVTAEVEVNMDTGEISVINIKYAQDFGRVINPKLCESQVVGGTVFGLGYALFEEGLFDRQTGKMLNNNLHEYRVPTAKDMPSVEVFFVESEDSYFAYNARGGAEVSNTPVPAAIINAIYNATGIWFNELPVTPEKIIDAGYNKR